MGVFEQVYESWIAKQIDEEKSPRRKELLKKGLSHGTIEYLRTIWFPVFGNLDHLYAEYEVRDMRGGYRYLDLAYMPGGAKGCIEIQDYRTHARDIETGRFKDLCMKQALLVLDDWMFLPIAYLSIKEDPNVCKQITLSFVGKFVTAALPAGMHWAQAETLRFARRLLRPFEPKALAAHLAVSERYSRDVLRKLVNQRKLVVASGKLRYRTYKLPEANF